MSDTETGTAFDSFIDALADDEGFYLECVNNHASLPPREVCPDCGESDFNRQSLPRRGEIASYTTIRAPSPQFDADAPYVLVIASIGPINLTGRLENAEPDADTVEIGQPISVGVREENNGERLVVFERE